MILIITSKQKKIDTIKHKFIAKSNSKRMDNDK
jgi:hypothetical protein